MHHALLSSTTAGTPVIFPWDYVAKRRRAAGLSVPALATMLGGKIYERHIRALETPGLRLRDVADLSVAMPFSVDVYRQLADLPACQHPPLCAGCGWDAHSHQPDLHDGLTIWSRLIPEICTRCEQQRADTASCD